MINFSKGFWGWSSLYFFYVAISIFIRNKLEYKIEIFVVLFVVPFLFLTLKDFFYKKNIQFGFYELKYPDHKVHRALWVFVCASMLICYPFIDFSKS